MQQPHSRSGCCIFNYIEVYARYGGWEQPDYGFPFLLPIPGQFLAMNLRLLGAAM